LVVVLMIVSLMTTPIKCIGEEMLSHGGYCA